MPDTILGWYRRLVARKFNGSKTCRGVGRPRVTSELEQLIVKMARENPGWGYDRIVGALANLGHEISDQTVGNILKRHSVPTAPERKHTTNWADFIRAHMAVLTGTDFFSLEVLTLRGLVTYYVLFFIHLESRKVEIAGITRHPDEGWMKQIARNVTMDSWGFLENCLCDVPRLRICDLRHAQPGAFFGEESTAGFPERDDLRHYLCHFCFRFQLGHGDTSSPPQSRSPVASSVVGAGESSQPHTRP